MKEWYSAAELPGLPGMPGTVQGVLKRAKRDVWVSRSAAGRKGSEFFVGSLGEETQRHLRTLAERAERKALMTIPQPDGLDADHRLQAAIKPSLPARPRAIVTNAEMTDAQRQTRDARLVLLAYLREHFPGRGGFHHFEAALKAGRLPETIVQLAARANGRAGSSRTISAATLYRIERDLAAIGPDALAPCAPPVGARPAWLPPVLSLYQTPQKPALAAVWRAARDADQGTGIPSLRTVQRHLAELPTEVREWGRMGARARRAIQPFVRRTTDGLWPMDVVTVDGHMAKCYVLRPDTGRRIRPELTAYMDIATRRVLGWSAWWAESQYAIWLALRAMILDQAQGVPAMQYSDNGAYRGETHRALLDRLGITPMFAQAYRAQARGAIERLNSSLWVPLARTQDTYCGGDADAEHFKRALARADDNGSGILTWTEWLDACTQAVADYNARPHTALKRGRETLSPDMAWAIAADEGWRPTLLDGDDLHELLPHETRTCLRGTVSLPWGVYDHAALRVQTGRKVRVHYDPADGQRVWIADAKGRLLCVAERDLNAKPYVPASALEHARTKREEGRVARLEARIAAARADETPLLDLTVVHEGQTYDLPDLVLDRSLMGGGIGAQPVSYRSSFTERDARAEVHAIDRLETDPARYAAWKELDSRLADGHALDDRETAFHAAFQTTSYWRTAHEIEAQWDAQWAAIDAASAAN